MFSIENKPSFLPFFYSQQKQRKKREEKHGVISSQNWTARKRDVFWFERDRTEIENEQPINASFISLSENDELTLTQCQQCDLDRDDNVSGRGDMQRVTRYFPDESTKIKFIVSFLILK